MHVATVSAPTKSLLNNNCAFNRVYTPSTALKYFETFSTPHIGIQIGEENEWRDFVRS
jgi:hypothetical protein